MSAMSRTARRMAMNWALLRDEDVVPALAGAGIPDH